MQSTQDTLYYSNSLRQLIFYDKTKEATGKVDLRASMLYDREFYRPVIQR
jgi:hypothetical protein